jgi:formylglycine-generating enzyme required for sulfatase activity
MTHPCSSTELGSTTALVVGSDSYANLRPIPRSLANRRLFLQAFPCQLEKTYTLWGNRFSSPDRLTNLINRIEFASDELLIIFYSGHSLDYDGETFLSHHGSQPRRRSTHIRLQNLVDTLSRALQARRSLLVLDTKPISLEFVPPNIAMVSRLTDISNRRWRQTGAEQTIGAFFDVCRWLPATVPGITLEELTKLANRLLRPTGSAVSASDASLLVSGTRETIRAPWIAAPGGELWLKDHERLSSSNRGSREDAVDELRAQLQHRGSRVEAQRILTYLRNCDDAENVRLAAQAALEPPSFAPKNVRERIPSPIRANDRLVVGELLPPFKVVHGGGFTMGSDPSFDVDSLPEERPVHIIQVSDFQISQYPITRALYRVYCTSVDSRYTPSWLPELGRDNWPATEVSWFDARHFCAWLSEVLVGSRKLRSGYEFRLPTEAEWEKTARGSDRRRFPWGNELAQGTFNGRSSGLDEIVSVYDAGSEHDSPYGVSGMIGNVWEWTSSAWGKSGSIPDFAYPFDPDDGREDPELSTTVRRVVRGGAYYYFDNCLRASTRNLMFPDTRHTAGGFRIVKSRIRQGSQ